MFFMAALAGAWAVVPEGRTVAAGLVLGTLGSLANAYLLRRRVDLIAQAAVENDGRRVGLGMANRLAVILIVVMAAYRFPEHLSMPAAIAGCFYVQFAIFFTAFIHNTARRNGKG